MNPIQEDAEEADNSANHTRIEASNINNDPSVTNLFADPVTRTRCLIQFIRIRKQRAEKEKARRIAIKKQKKDIKARLEVAKKGVTDGKNEIKQLENRLEELDQSRHQLVESLKAIHNREQERKRKAAEEEEKQRLLEIEQQQKAQQTANILNNAKLQLLGVLLNHRQNLMNVNNAAFTFPINSQGITQGSSTPPVGIPNHQQKLFAGLPLTNPTLESSNSISQQAKINSAQIQPVRLHHQSQQQILPQNFNSLTSALMNPHQQAQALQQLQGIHLQLEAQQQQQQHFNNNSNIAKTPLNMLSGLTPELAQILLSNFQQQ